jgi:hypothetical protein
MTEVQLEDVPEALISKSIKVNSISSRPAVLLLDNNQEPRLSHRAM